MKIKKYEIELEDIENYKKQGTVIISKENIILNKEKPTKYFFLQEKQITILGNEQGKFLTKTSDIWKNAQITIKNYTPNQKHVRQLRTNS